jgi:hypothetical protein
MAPPSSAPSDGRPGPGRPVPRMPGPPPPGARFGPPPGPGMPPPRPARPALTKAQRTRLVLVCSLALVLGALGGLVASLVLPHIYAAQTTVRFNLGADAAAANDDSDRLLTTQTVVITSRQVLQPVAASTGVPVDYLTKNVTATQVPNSEMIQIRVTHPDRPSGVQLADAVAKQYLQVANSSPDEAQLQVQLAAAQKALLTPAPGTLTTLQAQVSDLQNQLAAATGTTNDQASVVAPAASIPAAVFPNVPMTIGIGVLVGALVAAGASVNLVRSWTRR